MLPLDDIPTLADHFERNYNVPDADSKELVSNVSVGVEIELENAANILPAGQFTAITDGSLRDNGVEFVFRRPCSGKVVVDSLRGLEKNCNEAENRPRLSARTSVHVHVDCLDMTAAQISRMITLYEIFELVLFRAFASTRLNNHFCTRITECFAALSAQRYLADGFSSFFNRFEARDNQRYCALNLRALSKFGSVEFRHLAGTYDADKIITWTNVCLSLKRASLREIDFIDQFFMDSSRGWDTQIRDVFPVQIVDHIYQTYREGGFNLNDDILRGIRYAQNALIPKVKLF